MMKALFPVLIIAAFVFGPKTYAQATKSEKIYDKCHIYQTTIYRPSFEWCDQGGCSSSDAYEYPALVVYANGDYVWRLDTSNLSSEDISAAGNEASIFAEVHCKQIEY